MRTKQLHLINPRHIFTKEDFRILDKLTVDAGLNTLTVKEDRLFTNRKAMQRISVDADHYHLLENFGKRLRNTFGDEIKLQVIKESGKRDYIIEKLNFN